jgi:four helix bundle suffix protein
MPEREPLIPKHGGYRKLKSFQIAQLIYDVTVRFCDRYVDRRSRTHDQMVQAARSGVQNIAEGSQASGTSKKMELKLTNVARASLEELRLDYEDFLRQRAMALWAPDHQALVRFKAKRCSTLEEVRAWVEAERRRSAGVGGHRRARTATDFGGGAKEGSSVSVGGRSSVPVGGTPSVPVGGGSSVPVGGSSSVPVGGGPCRPPSSSELVANAALSLLNLCCHFLDRQLAAQAAAFEKEGGFTERLYRTRVNRRRAE